MNRIEDAMQQIRCVAFFGEKVQDLAVRKKQGGKVEEAGRQSEESWVEKRKKSYFLPKMRAYLVRKSPFWVDGGRSGVFYPGKKSFCG